MKKSKQAQKRVEPKRVTIRRASWLGVLFGATFSTWLTNIETLYSLILGAQIPQFWIAFHSSEVLIVLVQIVCAIVLLAIGNPVRCIVAFSISYELTAATILVAFWPENVPLLTFLGHIAWAIVCVLLVLLIRHYKQRSVPSRVLNTIRAGYRKFPRRLTLEHVLSVAGVAIGLVALNISWAERRASEISRAADTPFVIASVTMFTIYARVSENEDDYIGVELEVQNPSNTNVVLNYVRLDLFSRQAKRWINSDEYYVTDPTSLTRARDYAIAINGRDQKTFHIVFTLRRTNLDPATRAAIKSDLESIADADARADPRMRAAFNEMLIRMRSIDGADFSTPDFFSYVGVAGPFRWEAAPAPSLSSPSSLYLRLPIVQRPKVISINCWDVRRPNVVPLEQCEKVDMPVVLNLVPKT